MIIVVEHMEDMKDVSVLKQYAKIHPSKPFESYVKWILKQKNKDLINKWVFYDLISSYPKERMRDDKIKVYTPKGEKVIKCRYCEFIDQAFCTIEDVLKVMEE